jgi:hypothetical protein
MSCQERYKDVGMWCDQGKRSQAMLTLKWMPVKGGTGEDRARKRITCYVGNII